MAGSEKTRYQNKVKNGLQTQRLWDHKKLVIIKKVRTEREERMNEKRDEKM